MATNDTKEFLAAVYAPLPDGLWGYIWTARGKTSYSFRTTDHAARLVAQHGNGTDVYCGVGLSHAPLPSDRRVTDSTAAARIALVLDIDADGADMRQPEKRVGEPQPGERHPLGTEADEVLQRISAALVPPSVVVASGRGGYHCWWVYEQPWVIELDEERQGLAAMARRWQAACVRASGHHLDSVADLARILRVPGTHNTKNGGPYPVTLVSLGTRYDPADLAALVPQEQKAPRTDRLTAYIHKAVEGCAADITHAPEGTRHNTLFRAAARLGNLVGAGLIDLEQAREVATAAAERNGFMAEATRDATTTIADGLARGVMTPATLPADLLAAQSAPVATAVLPRSTQQTSWQETELGMAERFAAMHRGRVLWCGNTGCWYLWSGTRWEQDETEQILRCAKQTVVSLFAELAAMTDIGEEADKARERFQRFIAACQRERFIRSMLNLAKAEDGMAARVTDFDADDWLLNVQNGTVDLRTGALRPHRAEDLCRKLAPVTYDPQATAPTWEAFLRRIMAGNESMIDFLQRAVGASLPAHTREQVLLILHGSGANGKTTFVRTVLAMLGDYGASAEPQTLMARRNDDGVRNDIADLCGARCVATSETASGKRLDEALVKRLTGGDPVKARFLFHEFFTFTPAWRTWLATNHKPEVRGTDHAIWRRLRLVPFDVTIPDAEQDKDLPAKLETELSGILNWAMAGCVAWQNVGLEAPEEVTKATEGWRDDSDIVRRFTDERCCFGETLWCASADLRAAFIEWCREEDEKEMSSKDYTKALKALGLTDGRQYVGGTQIRVWRGLGLLKDGT